MTETPESFGISWEQIAIAGVCMLVLIVAGFVALRGGRRRRAARDATHETTFPYAPSDAPPMTRAAPPLEPRAEPLLAQAAAPAPSPPAASDLSQEVDALAAAHAQTAQTVKSLKADIDELRHAYVVAERRLADAEKRIVDLTGATTPVEPTSVEPTTARRKPPTPPSPAPPAASGDDPTVLRARRAIEQLGRD